MWKTANVVNVIASRPTLVPYNRLPRRYTSPTVPTSASAERALPITAMLAMSISIKGDITMSKFILAKFLNQAA